MKKNHPHELPAEQNLLDFVKEVCEMNVTVIVTKCNGCGAKVHVDDPNARVYCTCGEQCWP